MCDKTDNQEKLEKLAKDVLIISKNTLLVNLRFMDVALSQFKLIPIKKSMILTDGKYILYNPRYILKQYKEKYENVVRDYLHIVLHCVYRHIFVGVSVDEVYWDVACDIAVENIICELKIKSATTQKEVEQKTYIEQIKKEINIITAEKVYDYLRNTYPKADELKKIHCLFFADNHELWYMTDDEIKDKYGEEWNDFEVEAYGDMIATKSTMMKMWQNVAQRMQVDIESFRKFRGDTSGSLIQNLKVINREKYDYSSFLKKFAVMGEVMKINEDEFDYVFYTYGLQLYEKMPLIEPLEYKEIKLIKEFVIAIDTSGSVQGEMVQKFIQKTYNILKNAESFFNKINIYIIQCDSDIQEVVKITNQREFDEYIKKMKIRGLGGTDFRPVFEYIEKLKKSNAFLNLKGLIYFTDGMGVFPTKKPDYNTAFIYIDDEYNNYNVPPWAIKLVLEKNEI